MNFSLLEGFIRIFARLEPEQNIHLSLMSLACASDSRSLTPCLFVLLAVVGGGGGGRPEHAVTRNAAMS